MKKHHLSICIYIYIYTAHTLGAYPLEISISRCCFRIYIYIYIYIYGAYPRRIPYRAFLPPVGGGLRRGGGAEGEGWRFGAYPRRIPGA